MRRVRSTRRQPKGADTTLTSANNDSPGDREGLGPLDVDAIFGMTDLCAAEPIPPFAEELEHSFRACGGDAPVVHVEPPRSDDAGSCWTVSVKVKGELAASHPQVIGGARLSPDELSSAAAHAHDPQAHRPPWLDGIFAPRIRPRNFPVDHRILTTPIRPLIMESVATAWPWTAIGKVFIQRRGQPTRFGSGVLVGPNLLLTASHAMPWETNDYSVRFVPAYRGGNDARFGHAYVDEWRGVRNTDDVTGLDCVICKLNWRIGERAGWMGSWYYFDESSYEREGWISVGYPASFMGGQQPAVEIPVWVRDIDGDGNGLEIETHKFALGGWSGGPLWGWIGGQPRVIGIESGFEKDVFDPERTVFAGGKNLVDLVKFGIANWQ